MTGQYDRGGVVREAAITTSVVMAAPREQSANGPALTGVSVKGWSTLVQAVMEQRRNVFYQDLKWLVQFRGHGFRVKGFPTGDLRPRHACLHH